MVDELGLLSWGGWVGDSRVTQMGMMKNRPAIPPTRIHRLIALGTLVRGLAHSSALGLGSEGAGE